MVELPRLLHVLPATVGPVVIHGGNPATGLSGLTDLRFLAAEIIWPLTRDPLYVCCSHHVAGSFDRSRYLRRFRRCVVPNGVEPASGAVREPRTLPAVPDGEVVLGMMARLDAIKDHVTLLHALVEVVRVVPGARLELAGSGESEAALRALAAKLGLREKVRFLGMVTDVNAVMWGWDIFAYAATSQEGFGNAVAEALMAGLPAVVSDVAPLREVCGGAAGNVVYVPASDSQAMAAALLALIPDLVERRRLGAAGRSHALAELSANVFSARYAALLEAERRRPPEARGFV
jgi:glycosyltransferase involved in cell wall biosynthesis